MFIRCCHDTPCRRHFATLPAAAAFDVSRRLIRRHVYIRVSAIFRRRCRYYADAAAAAITIRFDTI